ncbi:MAG: hypothetical protein PUB10_08355 [Clostridiales bacterium]|nr:hypothetical protein [Clostridiales bacterium]
MPKYYSKEKNEDLFLQQLNQLGQMLHGLPKQGSAGMDEMENLEDVQKMFKSYELLRKDIASYAKTKEKKRDELFEKIDRELQNAAGLSSRIYEAMAKNSQEPMKTEAGRQYYLLAQNLNAATSYIQNMKERLEQDKDSAELDRVNDENLQERQKSEENWANIGKKYPKANPDVLDEIVKASGGTITDDIRKQFADHNQELQMVEEMEQVYRKQYVPLHNNLVAAIKNGMEQEKKQIAHWVGSVKEGLKNYEQSAVKGSGDFKSLEEPEYQKVMRDVKEIAGQTDMKSRWQLLQKLNPLKEKVDHFLAEYSHMTGKTGDAKSEMRLAQMNALSQYLDTVEKQKTLFAEDNSFIKRGWDFRGKQLRPARGFQEFTEAWTDELRGPGNEKHKAEEAKAQPKQPKQEQRQQTDPAAGNMRQVHFDVRKDMPDKPHSSFKNQLNKLSYCARKGAMKEEAGYSKNRVENFEAYNKMVRHIDAITNPKVNLQSKNPEAMARYWNMIGEDLKAMEDLPEFLDQELHANKCELMGHRTGGIYYEMRQNILTVKDHYQFMNDQMKNKEIMQNLKKENGKSLDQIKESDAFKKASKSLRGKEQVRKAFNRMLDFYEHRNDAKRSGHKDSPEYQKMISSIESLVGKDTEPWKDRMARFNKMEISDVDKKLENIRKASKEYLDAKRKQFRPIWSTQRDVRIYQAEALVNFVDTARVQNNFLMHESPLIDAVNEVKARSNEVQQKAPEKEAPKKEAPALNAPVNAGP